MSEKVVPMAYWHKKRTIETGLIDGKYTASEYEFDLNKTFRTVCVLMVGCAVSTALNPAIFFFWLMPFAFILSGSVIIGVGYLQGYHHRQYVNGKIYRYWLEDTHDLVYSVTILVTEWENFSSHGNTMTFFTRTLKRYTDRIQGEVHCQWSKTPIAFVEDLDFKRKAFREFKIRYQQPKLTGAIIEVTYSGQSRKENRYFKESQYGN